jgi:hypothetical protein
MGALQRSGQRSESERKCYEPRRLRQPEPTRYSHHSRNPGLPSDSRNLPSGVARSASHKRVSAPIRCEKSSPAAEYRLGDKKVTNSERQAVGDLVTTEAP